MSSETTLQGVIAAWRRRGDRQAVVALRETAPEVWSYERLVRTAQAVAGGLLRADLGRAEPVALLGPASPAWLACCFGTILAGGTAVPLDAQLPDDDATKLLLDGRCRRIFTTRRRAESLAKVSALAALQFFLLDAETDATPPPWTVLLTDDMAPLPTVDPTAPAIMLYTSGTTGMPKGVPLSHVNLLANVNALQAEALARPEDRVLLPLPLHHAYPFTVGMLGTFCSGGSLVLPASFSGPALARALGEATVLIGVPRLHAALFEAFSARLGPWQRYMLEFCVWARQRLRLPLGRWALGPLRRAVAPHLRLVVSGGAKLDKAVEWTLLAIGWQVLTGYGLTETAPMLSLNLPGHARVGSAGRPLRGVAIRIFQPDKSGIGEIQAKGANVFCGYWNKPELTHAAFTDDGWFRTGDLGRLDDEGYLYIASRATDLIVLPNGEKVLPEDVEAVYEQSGIIREVAVLEQEGVLVALVVPDEEALRAGGTAHIEGQLREDIDRLGRRLRSFQRVTRIAIARSALPRSPIGKLQRFRLPALWRKAAAGRGEAHPVEVMESDRALLADPMAAAVWAWLKTRFPDRAHSLDDSPQLDLGIDSLAWIGLAIEIEQRFGRNLGEESVGRIVTLRDLLHEVLAAPPAIPAAARPPAAESPEGRLSTLGTLLYLLNRAIMALCFRLRVEGLSNLPASGPFLLVPNHVSYLDPLAIAAALPRRRWREIHWAGWTELLFATPLMRLVSHACQVFPVDPRRGGLTAIAAAETLLQRKRIVVWFPEGGRSPDGSLKAFTPGIGMLIARTGVTAVPVRIRGSFEAWPLWRRLPRPHRLVVTFGQPIERSRLAPGSVGESSHREIAERLREAVAALE